VSTVYEWRAVGAPVELRADDDTEAFVAFGHAAVFDTPTEIYGITEIIERKSTKKSAKEADVRALRDHDPVLLLGRSAPPKPFKPTLRLAEDDIGLAYDVDLPDTTPGRDARISMQRGDMTGSSFGFRVIRDEWIERSDGTLERRIKEVALRDVGPVTFPAYVATDAALRSLAEVRSVSFDVAHEAALAGDLARLFSPNGGERPPTIEDEGRVSTFVPHRSWMYA
jgi:uncharacterized protein